MPTPDQYRRALALVSDRAVETAIPLLSSLGPTDTLVVATTDVIAYYSDGTAALAADQYDELREAARARGRFTAAPVVNLDEEGIRRGVLWAAEPLHGNDLAEATSRLTRVVQPATADAFRVTTTDNSDRDPAAVGWRRHSSGSGCKFCAMLASRGAVYKESTVHFAAHPHCSCSASPVFDGEDGEEASVMQYMASQRIRTDAESARLRAFLNTNYPEHPG